MSSYRSREEAGQHCCTLEINVLHRHGHTRPSAPSSPIFFTSTVRVLFTALLFTAGGMGAGPVSGYHWDHRLWHHEGWPDRYDQRLQTRGHPGGFHARRGCLRAARWCWKCAPAANEHPGNYAHRPPERPGGWNCSRLLPSDKLKFLIIRSLEAADRFDIMAENIHVKLPDGSVKDVPRGTSALDIAKSISPRLADAALAAQIKPLASNGNGSGGNGHKPAVEGCRRRSRAGEEQRPTGRPHPSAGAGCRAAHPHRPRSRGAGGLSPLLGAPDGGCGAGALS